MHFAVGQKLLSWFGRKKVDGTSETRWSTIRWHSQLGLLKQDLRLLSEVEPSFPPPALAGEVAKARDTINSQGNKLRAIVWGLIGFLVLTHFGVPLPISVAGLTLQAGPGVQELCLVATAVVSAWLWTKSLSAYFLTDALRVLSALDKRDDDLRSLREMVLMPDQPPPINTPQMQPYLTWSFGVMFAQIIKLLLMALVIFAAAWISFWWRWEIYWHVWNVPSVDASWAQSAVLITLAIDVGSLLYVLLHFVPLPHRDYLVSYGYNAICESNPELADLLSMDNKVPSQLAEAFLDQFRTSKVSPPG